LTFVLNFSNEHGLQPNQSHIRFHAGSHPPEGFRNSGFGTVFIVEPNDVYLLKSARYHQGSSPGVMGSEGQGTDPSLYKVHHRTPISRKNAQTSVYDQSSIGWTLKNAGQDGSVGASGSTSTVPPNPSQHAHRVITGLSEVDSNSPPLGSPRLVPTKTARTPRPPPHPKYWESAAFIPPPNR